MATEYIIDLTDIQWDGAPKGTPTTHSFTVQGYPDEEERMYLVDEELARVFGWTHNGYAYEVIPS